MSTTPIPRRAHRQPVSLAAQCRSQAGTRDSGLITDITAHGCRVTTRTLALRAGARVVIRPEGLEGLTGVVRWIAGTMAGVEFDMPIYGPVVDHLAGLHRANTAVPIESC